MERTFDLKRFAERLDGRQYGYPMFSEEELDIAKENSVIIVTGASDDLIEFDGIIYDEGDCYEGGKIWIDAHGITEKDAKNAKCIEAVWCGKDASATWTYITDIPHETFRIYENDEVYCEGLVFFRAAL